MLCMTNTIRELCNPTQSLRMAMSASLRNWIHEANVAWYAEVGDVTWEKTEL